MISNRYWLPVIVYHNHGTWTIGPVEWVKSMTFQEIAVTIVIIWRGLAVFTTLYPLWGSIICSSSSPSSIAYFSAWRNFWYLPSIAVHKKRTTLAGNSWQLPSSSMTTSSFLCSIPWGPCRGLHMLGKEETTSLISPPTEPKQSFINWISCLPRCTVFESIPQQECLCCIHLHTKMSQPVLRQCVWLCQGLWCTSIVEKQNKTTESCTWC